VSIYHLFLFVSKIFITFAKNFNRYIWKKVKKYKK